MADKLTRKDLETIYHTLGRYLEVHTRDKRAKRVKEKIGIGLGILPDPVHARRLVIEPQWDKGQIWLRCLSHDQWTDDTVQERLDRFLVMQGKADQKWRLSSPFVNDMNEMVWKATRMVGKKTIDLHAIGEIFNNMPAGPEKEALRKQLSAWVS